MKVSQQLKVSTQNRHGKPNVGANTHRIIFKIWMAWNNARMVNYYSARMCNLHGNTSKYNLSIEILNKVASIACK